MRLVSPKDPPRGSRSPPLEVDDEGLLVRGAGDGPVDFLFDDQRVGSFWLLRDTEPEGNWLRYPWPPALRRFLDGAVTVTLADPVDGTRWVSRDARLGSGEGAVQVRDAHGNPMGLDKSNRLSRLFGDRDAGPPRTAPGRPRGRARARWRRPGSSRSSRTARCSAPYATRTSSATTPTPTSAT